MTGPGDEFGDMNEVPLTRPTRLGRDGSDAEVAQFLAELRGLGECAAPAPSPELRALLGGARPLRRHAVRLLARTAAVAAAAVAASVVAAANHDLPSPAQRVVSNVVNVLTPFHIDPRAPGPLPSQHQPPDRDGPGTAPEPTESGESGTESDEPSRSAEPSESDVPAGSARTSPSDDGSGSGDSHDGGGETDAPRENTATGDGGQGDN